MLSVMANAGDVHETMQQEVGVVPLPRFEHVKSERMFDCPGPSVFNDYLFKWRESYKLNGNLDMALEAAIRHAIAAKCEKEDFVQCFIGRNIRVLHAYKRLDRANLKTEIRAAVVRARRAGIKNTVTVLVNVMKQPPGSR